ncbi:hypothetical protein [Cysteiniphilum sp. QT6929]|uniref:hypothetical protein n=1 Tax=Cysteiniphilum sp. QT6929 TaxID=2975055 RepID=UPI0024B3A9D5|nr:hypothetical protein [Cysteiniphilum sp. QT6929]WHN66768.1 hypothetical protein NYP54_11490 [Cysteiniphilum sp. QT6929]
MLNMDMPKSSTQRMKVKRERDYQLLLDSVGSEQKLSDTGLIEVIARCYRQAKQSGNTAMVKITVKELVRRIDSIDEEGRAP